MLFEGATVVTVLVEPNPPVEEELLIMPLPSDNELDVVNCVDWPGTVYALPRYGAAPPTVAVLVPLRLPEVP